MRDEFAVVARFGDRLLTRSDGWEIARSLIVHVARAGDWNGAGCLADALGVGPETQELIYEVSVSAPEPRGEAEVVATTGEWLRADERGGWRDLKGLVLLVARAGKPVGALALGQTLGVSDDELRGIFEEAYPHVPTGGTS